jgi:hypothetical protein
MHKNRSLLRPVTVVSSFIPSVAALRDFLLVLLAWSMFMPTLALAGAVGAKTAGLRPPSGSDTRAHGRGSCGATLYRSFNVEGRDERRVRRQRH